MPTVISPQHPPGSAPRSSEHSAFIRRMDEWRRERGESNSAFAAHLGLSRSYWLKLRTGDRRLSIGVLQTVIAERPEFAHYLVEDVRARANGMEQVA